MKKRSNWKFGILKPTKKRGYVVYIKLKFNGETYRSAIETTEPKKFLQLLKDDKRLREAYQWPIYRLIGMRVTGNETQEKPFS